MSLTKAVLQMPIPFYRSSPIVVHVCVALDVAGFAAIVAVAVVAELSVPPRISIRMDGRFTTVGGGSRGASIRRFNEYNVAGFYHLARKRRPRRQQIATRSLATQSLACEAFHKFYWANGRQNSLTTAPTTSTLHPGRAGRLLGAGRANPRGDDIVSKLCGGCPSQPALTVVPATGPSSRRSWRL